MYHHIKKLMYTVRVDEPDPRFGNMLLEQFGGANGELAAAMQYSIQGLNCEDAARKDIRDILEKARGCCLEIIMKDHDTIHNDPSRAVAWCKIAKEEIGRYYK